MTQLSDVLGDWSSFYSAVAQVSGSLIGLLFVSLSMRAELLRKQQHSHLRDLALQTFNDFLCVLVMSLVLLVPHMPNTALAVIIGLFAIRSLVRLLMRIWGLRKSGVDKRFVVSRFGLSLVGNGLMLLAADAVWNPRNIDPMILGSLLVTPLILLTMAGSGNALNLLLRELEPEVSS